MYICTFTRFNYDKMFLNSPEPTLRVTWLAAVWYNRTMRDDLPGVSSTIHRHYNWLYSHPQALRSKHQTERSPPPPPTSSPSSPPTSIVRVYWDLPVSLNMLKVLITKCPFVMMLRWERLWVWWKLQYLHSTECWHGTFYKMYKGKGQNYGLLGGNFLCSYFFPSNFL